MKLYRISGLLIAFSVFITGLASAETPTSISEGCFAPGTRITMVDQSLRPIENVTVGDIIFNPATKGGSVVKRVVKSPEPYHLIKISTAKNILTVSRLHPMITKNGIKKAANVKVGELLLMSDGKYASVVRVGPSPVFSNQHVFNVELIASKSGERRLIAEGIVTGDIVIQNSLK